MHLRPKAHHNFPWDDFTQDLGIMGHREKKPTSFTFIFYAVCSRLCCQMIISKPLGHFCPLMEVGTSSLLLQTYSRFKERFTLGSLELNKYHNKNQNTLLTKIKNTIYRMISLIENQLTRERINWRLGYKLTHLLAPVILRSQKYTLKKKRQHLQKMMLVKLDGCMQMHPNRPILISFHKT